MLIIRQVMTPIHALNKSKTRMSKANRDIIHPKMADLPHFGSISLIITPRPSISLVSNFSALLSEEFEKHLVHHVPKDQSASNHGPNGSPKTSIKTSILVTNNMVEISGLYCLGSNKK